MEIKESQPVASGVPILHIALVEPEIAPNTGNIARLCAATAVRLHLIGRLGFHLDDRSLRRAGCDYWPHVDVHLHVDWHHFCKAMPLSRRIGIEANVGRCYSDWTYRAGDVLVFGSESKGLPISVQEECAALLHVPMPTGLVRSLNLATTAGIVMFEALKQICQWPTPANSPNSTSR